MKNLIPAILLLLLTIPAFAQEKTDDELLQETVALSKEVKEFGKTIGIEPTETLTKSSNGRVAESRLWIWVQNKGSLSFDTMSVFVLYFKDVKEKIPLSNVGILSGNVNIYFRSENQFSTAESSITADFAAEPRWRRVEVVLHEDMHQNIKNMSWHDNEAITTVIARLAALEYFKSKNDDIGSAKISILIKNSRLFSRELLELVSSQPEHIDNEAKIMHDLAYYKYFDRVVALYEKSGNLKKLIEDIKNAPAETSVLEKYLDDLDKKYSAPQSGAF